MSDCRLHGIIYHIAKSNDSVGHMARINKIAREKHMDARILPKHLILRKHAAPLRRVRQSAETGLKNTAHARHAGLLDRRLTPYFHHGVLHNVDFL